MARRSSRHLARRTRRLTPRRWIALVAIPVALVGAGVVDRGHSERQGPGRGDQPETTALSNRMPTASRATSLSSTWYCAAGSAAGADGDAELSVVVANLATTAVPATVTVYRPNGKIVSKDVQVPAEGRTRVNAADLTEGRWVGAMVEARGGQVAVERAVRGPNGFDAGPCSSTSAERWYFAAGTTVRGATQRLALLNPYQDGVSVDISFVTDDGVSRTPRTLQGYQVPAHSVQVVDVTPLVSRREVVATTVATRGGRIIADRILDLDGSGDGTPAKGSIGATVAPRGLAVSVGAPEPSPVWSFPSVRSTVGARNQVVVFNPSDREAEVDVEVALDDPKRNGTLDPFELTIDPGSVQVLDLTAQETIPEDVGMSVTARSVQGVPVVAEHVLTGGKPWGRVGASTTLGSPLAARSWLLAAGGATDDETEQIAIANPSAAPAKVRLRVLATGSLREAPGLSPVTVPGRSRTVVDLAKLDDADLPLVVTADRPVVVERSLFLAGRPGISVAMGMPLPETVTALSVR